MPAILFLLTDNAWKIILFCFIGITVLFILKHIVIARTNQSIFLCIGFFVSISMLALGKEEWYLLYFQPFITLMYAQIIQSSFRTKLFPYVMALGVVLFFSQFMYIVNNVDTVSDYHAFTQKLQQALPKQGNIFLSVIPDPYMDLQKNSQLTFYEFPTVPISANAYINLLSQADYVVYSYSSSLFLFEYLQVNTAQQTIIKQSDKYHAEIVQLVPKNKRKNIF